MIPDRPADDEVARATGETLQAALQAAVDARQAYNREGSRCRS
jgi:hypothetical protein